MLKSTGGAFRQPDGEANADSPPAVTKAGAGAGKTLVATPQARRVPVTAVVAPSKREKAQPWIDKLISKKQELKKVLSTTPLPVQPAGLSITHLTRFPEALEKKIAALAHASTVPDSLLRAIWITFERNTRDAITAWEVVDAGVRPDAFDPDPHAQGEADQHVMGRFPDIPLPATSAISDVVRSARYGVPHYLHANHVDLACGRHLIASQKPVAAEIAGFQRMLLDQQVALVVDLTRHSEREAHNAYVPEQPGASFAAQAGGPAVSCIRQDRIGAIKGAQQLITIAVGTTHHALQRLRFPNWPDHGVVEADALIALADKIDSISPDPRRPLVIHCLAGVGRTGTLMSFLAARRKLSMLRTEGKHCTPDVVLRTAIDVMARGRIDRGPTFVQMEAQFWLLITALLKDCNSTTALLQPQAAPVAGEADIVRSRAASDVATEVRSTAHAGPADLPRAAAHPARPSILQRLLQMLRLRPGRRGPQ